MTADSASERATERPSHPGTGAEVLLAFLRLGLTAFGGPVAHLGYFREEFVARRRWLDERAYADLVALCQFLPGPASSQVGMALGLQRAGWRGMLAAWAGFTLPSAVLLIAFAYGAVAFEGALGGGWLAGLRAAAVAVVAHAVLGMARSLTPDARRATIAAGGMIAVLLVPSVLTQLGVILLAAVLGLWWLRDMREESGDGPGSGRQNCSEGAPKDCPEDGRADEGADPPAFTVRVPRAVAVGALAVFGLLLLALPLLAGAVDSAALRMVDLFYRAGALVFGGGHIVLPLLQAETVAAGTVDSELFLAGYGAAQAVPGPLFTFAAYLGAVMDAPAGAADSARGGALSGGLALLAIFLPSALLVVGALPFWERLRSARWARSALMGVNAGVVGILAAALYDPVFTQGITSVPSLALAIAALLALHTWRAPAWAVVLAAALLGALVL